MKNDIIHLKSYISDFKFSLKQNFCCTSAKQTLKHCCNMKEYCTVVISFVIMRSP